ncbi:MAG: MlaD family protein, partial [Gemmatimonadota bacterium]
MAPRAKGASGLGWSRVRVGTVIIVALLALAYGIYEVGSLFDVFAERYPLRMPVETTGGLVEGAPVTLAGKRVGQVEAIEFIPIALQDRGHNIMLTLSVDEEVAEHIRRDSDGRIRTQGLMGDRYVDIRPGSLAFAALEPGDTLSSEPTVDVDLVVAEAYDALLMAQDVLEDARAVTAGLRRGEGTLGRLLVDESLYEEAGIAAGEAAGLLREIRSGEGTLGRLVTDPALYDRLTTVLARIDTLGATLTEGRGTLGRLIASDTVYRDIRALLAGARTTLARADTMIGGVGTFLDGLGAGVDGPGGTLQRLLTDPRLYEEFLL